MSYTLLLRQQVTVLQNRYTINRLDESGETPLAYAEQKRVALREKVTFYPDRSSRTTPVFTFAARNILELVGTYDVADPTGAVLATLRKDPVASLARSTYRLDSAAGSHRAGAHLVASAGPTGLLGGQRPTLAASLQFDFIDSADQLVMSIDRQLRLRDRYRVEVHRDELDWRVAACAVAIDALMDR